MSRILVIDDNELISRMLNDGLSEHGFEVRTAPDANKGYAEALQFAPDLILLDIQLPDVTGYDLCRMMKNNAELRDVPIIMVTGSARSTEEKVKGFQLGIDDYLLKPFEMPELLERVRAVLRRSEGRRAKKTAASSSARATPKPANSNGPQRLPVAQGILRAILAPSELPSKAFVPGISLVFIFVSLGICYTALALSAGVKSSPALIGISGIGLWGLAVAVLVMGSSIVGISMNWKEGAGLISLAATPLLLKLGGALVTSLWTTLSPFYYSAGLTLFWEDAPRALGRMDAFELWALYLLCSMLRRWPGSSRKKAWTVTLLVWGACAALATAMGSRGNP
jgi:CheY-like chemotaxis protein